ncbi:MAG: 3-deoxy-manno-octulosonate cytidylyltransferase [Lentisphaerae bacterium]|nr:3-deoxy-manno-octulosonate cytidylyltransferase [Lentisphaerota bacterium]
MRVVAVIPARWGSTRFPGKSLALIAGKSLIQRVVERCRQAKRLDDLLVATDDERIQQAVVKLGARVVMTRRDHASGTDRVAEALQHNPAELVVNVQGDEPLIDPNLIDRLVAVMISESEWDMTTAAAPLTAAEAKNPSICKVVVDEKGRALYFSRSPIPYIRERNFQAAGTIYWRHIGIYAYRAAFLARLAAAESCLLERAECLEQLRALYLGGRIKVETVAHSSLGVDTPEDVGKVEAELRSARGGSAYGGKAGLT